MITPGQPVPLPAPLLTLRLSHGRPGRPSARRRDQRQRILARRHKERVAGGRERGHEAVEGRAAVRLADRGQGRRHRRDGEPVRVRLTRADCWTAARLLRGMAGAVLGRCRERAVPA